MTALTYFRTLAGVLKGCQGVYCDSESFREISGISGGQIVVSGERFTQSFKGLLSRFWGLIMRYHRLQEFRSFSGKIRSMSFRGLKGFQGRFKESQIFSVLYHGVQMSFRRSQEVSVSFRGHSAGVYGGLRGSRNVSGTLRGSQGGFRGASGVI